MYLTKRLNKVSIASLTSLSNTSFKTMYLVHPIFQRQPYSDKMLVNLTNNQRLEDSMSLIRNIPDIEVIKTTKIHVDYKLTKRNMLFGPFNHSHTDGDGYDDNLAKQLFEDLNLEENKADCIFFNVPAMHVLAFLKIQAHKISF